MDILKNRRIALLTEICNCFPYFEKINQEQKSFKIMKYTLEYNYYRYILIFDDTRYKMLALAKAMERT